MTKRLALLFGNTKFEDSENFPTLQTSANDARDLAAVLEKRCDFEIVGTLVDADCQVITQAIEDLYGKAQRGDLTLLYYSGHGYKGRDNKLYLVARNTRVDRLLTTGIRESFIHDAMSLSFSRHRIVILDSCFSGAFMKGRKGGSEPLMLDELKGEATAILASSGTIQYSFEEKSRHSLFTHYILDGIQTGQADAHNNGVILIDELFSYAERKVRENRPEQTPMIELTARESEIVIARNPHAIKSQRIQKHSSIPTRSEVNPYQLTRGTLLNQRYRIEKGLAYGETYVLYQAFDDALGDKEVTIGTTIDPIENKRKGKAFNRDAFIYAAKNHPVKCTPKAGQTSN